MTEKKCTKCEEVRPLSAFSSNRKSKDGLQHECKPCQKKYYEDRYEREKDIYKDRADARYRALRDWVNELKSAPCVDCGGTFDPICMDFDHLPEFEKSADVSRMLRRRMAKSKIEAEIAKCELVCANCHRLRSKSRWEAEE